MLENQDKMLDTIDQTRTEISSEIRELQRDLGSCFDEKLIKIESDILHIKEKIWLKT